MLQQLPKRSRRLVWTVAGCAAFVCLAAGVFWFTRPQSRPYLPGERVEGITDSLSRPLPPDYPRVTFTDVTQAAGIDMRHFDGERSTQLPEDMGSGAAWGDYDNDGWVDLYVVNFAGPLNASPDAITRSPASNRLFKNNGNGTFRDVTELARVGVRGFGMGAAWGDFDGDGDLDLAVTNFGSNLLFRNDGSAGFTDVSGESGVGGTAGFWTGVSWADYDRDGRLDIYICGYVNYASGPSFMGQTSQQGGVDTPASLNPMSFPAQRSLLYHNNADGTFTEVAPAAGVDNPTGRSFSASWADFNNDAWPDLYVATDGTGNKLYLNQRDGTFADVSRDAWVADVRPSMGVAIADWDGDLDLDIFVTHWIAQEDALYTNQLLQAASSGAGAAPPGVGGQAAAGAAAGPPGEGVQAVAAAAPTGGLRFMDEADAHGLGQIALDFVGFGTSFFDYDNDGRPDLFVVNGSTFQQKGNPKALIPMQNHLFWNHGADGYYELGRVSGEVFKEERVGRGLAVADYDNDGDTDAFVVNHGAAPMLLRNDGGNAKRWFKIRLKGQGNTSGIGAKITAKVGDKLLFSEVGAGSSYLSQNAAEVVLGCGSAASVDSIKVNWPDGTEQVFAAAPTNQIVQIVHGPASGPAVGGAPSGSGSGTAEGERTAPGAASGPGGAQTAPGAASSSASSGLPARVGPSSDDRQRVQQFWETYRNATSAMKTQQDWRAAAELFRQALVLNPTHEDSLYYLGNCLLEMDDYAGALQQYEQLVTVNPQSLRGFLQIGAVHSSPNASQLFNLPVAAKAFQSALALNPEESGSLLQLGAVELAAGNQGRASQYFAMARRLNPRAIDAYYLDGYVHWKQGDMTGAEALLQKAVTLSRAPVPTPLAPSEGDTQRTGQAAMVSLTAHLQRLFSQQVARLRAPAPGTPAPPVYAATEYAAVDQYIAALGGR